MSPLRWPTIDAWWSDAERRVAELFPGANVMMSTVGPGGLTHYSESVDAGTRRYLSTFHMRDERTGRLLSRDHPLELWYEYRARHRISACDRGRRVFALLLTRSATTAARSGESQSTRRCEA